MHIAEDFSTYDVRVVAINKAGEGDSTSQHNMTTDAGGEEIFQIYFIAGGIGAVQSRNNCNSGLLTVQNDVLPTSRLIPDSHFLPGEGSVPEISEIVNWKKP